MHLYDTYGDITPASIAANDERLRDPYDGNTPIETFFEQIQDAQDFSVAAKSPYDTQHLLDIASNTLNNSGIITEACREWRLQPIVFQSWTTFKTFFARAYRDYKESSSTTADQDGYSAAVEMAINEIHNATVTDRKMVLSLQTTLNALHQQVSSLSGLNGQPSAYSPTPARINQQRTPAAARPRGGAPRNYFWAHVFRVAHASRECRTPAYGHQNNATATNTMGGSIRGYHRLYGVDPPASLIPPAQQQQCQQTAHPPQQPGMANLQHQTIPPVIHNQTILPTIPVQEQTDVARLTSGLSSMHGGGVRPPCTANVHFPATTTEHNTSPVFYAPVPGTVMTDSSPATSAPFMGVSQE